MKLTFQEKNQLAAALRVFQWTRHAGGELPESRERPVLCHTIATMEHFEETAQYTDDQIEALVDRIYDAEEN